MTDRIGTGPRPITTPSTSTTSTTTPTPATPSTSGTPAAWAPKSNDKVLFVAVNNSDAHRSTQESDALKARGVNITVIKDTAKDDVITTRDAAGRVTEHDLAKPEGAMSFALTLGLPAEQTKKIADVLSSGGIDARDELAQIAQQWAVAEKGGQPPSRLVLSGHHVGYGVYGENNGKLDWPTVGALAEAMPRGAKSVEDLLIAGCYSGGENMMEKYQAMFPNAKTIMAYSGSSPGAASGATAHQKAWEQATRGSGDGLDRKIFQGMRKGENVSVWTRTKGFDDGSPRTPLSDLQSRRAELQAGFDDAWKGGAIPDTQRGPVRDYYNSLQRLIQHPETTPADRKSLELQRDQTIRLIFYGPVSSKFQDTYATKIDAGFKALGMTPPNFKTLGRAGALGAIAEFETKLAANPGNPAADQLAGILRDFKELKPSLIPDTWV
ncbi:MAG: hypothetical protein U0228_39010 [Myxococcaceae bacterium]